MIDSLRKITIEESDMIFGPFREDEIIRIEKTKLYKKKQQNIKIVEFIYKKQNNIIFLEAKQSSPQSINDYVSDIIDKFSNALDMFISANLGILEDRNDELTSLINIDDVKNYQITFYLVIKYCKDEWLKDIADAILKKLIAKRNIYKLNIFVLNEDKAKNVGLVL